MPYILTYKQIISKSRKPPKHFEENHKIGFVRDGGFVLGGELRGDQECWEHRKGRSG